MSVIKSIYDPTLNLIDESLDLEKTNSYHLSILADANKVSLSILNTLNNKYLAIQSFPYEMEKLTNHIGLFDRQYKSVTCAIAHHRFTLTPSAIFDGEHKNSLLSFNHPPKNQEEVFTNSFHSLDAKNIFYIPEQVASALRKKLPNVNFIHNATSLVEGILIRNKNSSGKIVFADFHSNYFEVLILDEGKLIFSNAFTFNAPEDIAYYILFLYEQLHLNTDHIELIISGEIEKTSTHHSLLYNYIRHIKFATRIDNFSYSYKFKEIDSHKFYSLFNQYLCA